MYHSQSLRFARKVLTLVLLLFTLGFLMYDNSVAPVKAYDDCNMAYDDLSQCYYNCAVGDCAISNQACLTCYNACESAHSEYGNACGLPHYSPMLSSAYSCSRNSDQLMANCLAGQLPPVWQQRYLDQLVAQDGDMDAACTQLVWDYQNQECY